MDIKDMYPGRDLKYGRELTKLQEDRDVSDTNRKDLISFCRHLLGTGRTHNYRAGKLLAQLRRLIHMADANLRDLDIEGWQSLIIKINSLERSEATKADYRRVAKEFMIWYEYIDPRFKSQDRNVVESTRQMYLYLKKEIKTHYTNARIVPAEILTGSDIDKVVKTVSEDIQEQAIVATLHETGMRCSDLALTTLSGFWVAKDGVGHIMTGAGKTGRREVLVVKSLPYLLAHKKVHPHREDPSWPLFYFVDKRSGKISPFNHERLYSRVRALMKRAGIKKKVNLHWFRHSRISLYQMDGKLSVSVINRLAGWAPNSDQIYNYTHLNDREVQRAWKAANNIPLDEGEQPSRRCTCNYELSPLDRHCPMCGRPASLEVIDAEKEFQSEIAETLHLVPNKEILKKEFLETLRVAMQISQDPKQFDAFMKFRDKQNKK